MKKVGASLKMLAGLIFALASIVYANVAFFDVPDSQPNSATGDAPVSGLPLVAAQPRCPEDAVRLLTEYPHDKGACATVDDLPEGQVRGAAFDMSASCQPVGTAVVSVEGDEVVGWCNHGAST